MEPRLKNRLDGLVRMLRRARLLRVLTLCWVAATVFGFLLLLVKYFNLVLPLALGLVLVAVAFFRWRKKSLSLRELFAEVEPDPAGVENLFSTATEQAPADISGSYGFLQWRVINEALHHPRWLEWRKKLNHRLLTAQLFHGLALIAFILVLLGLARQNKHGGGASVFAGIIPDQLSVTPGDTNMERGMGLAVAARFEGAPPAESTLVFVSASGHESRLPMARRLADPVFGASIPEISEGAIYHIEYGGKKSRDYKISVFDYPALVRADADLHFPAYTGLTNRTIRDTLRVSAVEGSRLRYTLQLNKPVAHARLAGTSQNITLQNVSNSIALLPDFVLTNTAHFSLELLDAEGRSNKFPTDIVFQALTNQRPFVKIDFPHGDPRVSPLQELHLQAEASDDFGVLKYGVGFSLAGQPPQFVELGQSVPANAKRQFDYLIALEKLDVQVDQSVTYFAWADDNGPDGRPRRTFSDMFFADVRPFDEIFRQDQSGGAQEQSEAQGGGGDERVRLAQLQKQIVVATWNLEKNGAGRAPPP